MNRVLSISLVALPLLLVYMQANAKTSTQQGYETATVVSVDKYETPSNYVGGNADRRPLQAQDNSVRHREFD